MSLIQLIYTSAATHAHTAVELQQMLKGARERNQSRGITGILLYKDGTFLHLLEGEEAAVESLFAKICRDPRHIEITPISRGPIVGRNFADWEMGFVFFGEHLHDELPGFVDFFGSRVSLLELNGDADLARRILHGFKEGRWRHSVAF